MNFAVLQFPGSNCDQECGHRAAQRARALGPAAMAQRELAGDAEAVIVPGGFSYGDYLRTGAIARFSPVMGAVQAFAAAGPCPGHLQRFSNPV